MSGRQPILSGRNIVKHYGRVTAIDHADFDLYPGEILAVIGETPGDAKPKLAPFWRSGLVLPSMEANLQAIQTLQDDGGLAELLPPDAAFNAGSLRFQLSEADTVFEGLRESGRPWSDIAEEPSDHDRLTYATIPITGALEILADRYPAALGLILGFNSLDGD